MKKRNFLLILMIIGLFLFIGEANAEEDKTCNAVSLNELRTAASNIKVSYVPGTKTVQEELTGGNGLELTDSEQRHLDIKIYNVTEKLYVKVESSGANVSGEEMVVSSTKAGPDGSITIRQKAQPEMVTYTFTVLSDAYGCSAKTLRRIKLTLPRFNYYSQLSICADVPEYYLCQEYTTYKVDGSTFYDKVDDYKAKLLAQEKDKEGIDLEDNTGIISKTVSAVSKNKFIIVGVIVLAGVIATIYILKRKKSDL